MSGAGKLPGRIHPVQTEWREAGTFWQFLRWYWQFKNVIVG